MWTGKRRWKDSGNGQERDRDVDGRKNGIGQRERGGFIRSNVTRMNAVK